MLQGSKKRIQGLPGQGTSADIGNGNRQHERHFDTGCFHSLLRSENGSLGIQRIEYRLYQNRIHPPFKHGLHLLPVSNRQFIISQGAASRIIHIRTHGASLVGRSYGTGDKTRLFGSLRRVFVGKFARQLHGGEIYLTHIFLHMIIRHRHRSRTERIRFNYIRPGLQILAVNILNHIGTCQA